MSRDLKEQLHRLRFHTAPDPSWVRRNREVLLRQARNITGEPAVRPVSVAQFIERAHQAVRMFVPKNLFVLGRTVGLTTLAALVAVSGWIATVNAAYNSLPGDALYNVKLATEQTELIVASVVGNDTDRVSTILRHASHRVEEYQKSKTSDQATRAIQSLRKSIESTSKSLDNKSSTSLSATAVAKVVNEKTDQLLKSLEAASTTVPSAVTTDGKNIQTGVLQKQVDETTHFIEVTGVKAVQVLAEKTLAGDQNVSQQEVKTSVEKKLDKIATDITGLNNDVKGVAAVASSSTNDTVAAPAAGVFLPSAMASTTEQKRVEANKIVEKTVAEAKVLIGNNDLLGAIKKVEALTEIKKDAGTAVMEAKILTGAFASTTTASLLIPTAVSSSLQSTATSTAITPKPVDGAGAAR